MDLLNETVLLETKSTLFNLLIRESSQFLCYEKLLSMTYVAYKSEMQFWSHCYTVVPYQALFRLSVYKIPAVHLSGAKMCVFARYATLVPLLTGRLLHTKYTSIECLLDTGRMTKQIYS